MDANDLERKIKLGLALGFATMFSSCVACTLLKPPPPPEPATLVRICNDTNGAFRGYAMSDIVKNADGHRGYMLDTGRFAPEVNSHVCYKGE
jgi:hypothetical protein